MQKRKHSTIIENNNNILPYKWFTKTYYINAESYDTIQNIVLRIWDEQMKGTNWEKFELLSTANLTLIYQSNILKEWSTLVESSVDFSVGVYAHLSFPIKRG